MSDHDCPACQIHRELIHHRDNYAAGWPDRRAMLNFAAIIAERACPEYREEAQNRPHTAREHPSGPEGAADSPEPGERRTRVQEDAQ